MLTLYTPHLKLYMTTYELSVFRKMNLMCGK